MTQSRTNHAMVNARHAAGRPPLGLLLALIALLALALGAGCKKEGDVGSKCTEDSQCNEGLECNAQLNVCAPKQPENAAVARFAKLADELCACKDVACADDMRKKVVQEMDASGNEKVTKKEREKIKATLKKITDCTSKWKKGGAAKPAPKKAE